MNFVPKEDWVSGELLMHTDMNRIEEGIEEYFLASKGDEGPPGPEGPQGPIGPKGDPGPGVAVTSPANHGVTSDLATGVKLIKQGRLANLIMTVWTKGTAKTSGSYNQLGTLPVGYRGLGFQTVTVPGSSKTVTIDVYENGGVWVVWNTARAAGDTTTTRVAITYFTES